jgi:hypothetical protein
MSSIGLRLPVQSGPRKKKQLNEDFKKNKNNNSWLKQWYGINLNFVGKEEEDG